MITDNLEETKLGTFGVKSGGLIVSDPYYEMASYCTALLAAANGDWEASVWKNEEGRCAILEVRLKGEAVGLSDSRYRLTHKRIGVDSGQAGFFDVATFRNDGLVKPEMFTEGVERVCENEPWYSLCCNRTNGPVSAGIVPNGAVSASGYGDGSYRLWSITGGNGAVTSAKLVFIDEEEDQDY